MELAGCDVIVHWHAHTWDAKTATRTPIGNVYTRFTHFVSPQVQSAGWWSCAISPQNCGVVSLADVYMPE